MSGEAPEFEPLDPATAVTVGRIAAAQGIGGELRVQPLTDFPERFEPGSVLWLEGAPRRVLRSRWQKGLVYLRIEGVESRDAAEALRGKELLVPRAHEIDAAEGRFYLHDVLGLRVETEAGEALGAVADVLSTGANDVYVVRGDRGELLLPAVEDVVKRIDVTGGRMVVELLPGLEFRQKTSGVPRRRSRAPPTRRGRPARPSRPAERGESQS